MQAFFRKQSRTGLRTFAPRLEMLERRLCLACDIGFEDGQLVVSGDKADNVVAITADGAGGVTVSCDDGEEQSFEGVEGITVDLGQGNDSATIDLSAGGFSSLSVSVEGGKDVFVHHSAIEAQGFRTLSEGDRVEFTLENGPKGPAAAHVRKI